MRTVTTEQHLANSIMTTVRKWLLDNAGEENVDWHWNRGDLRARGVYIEDESIAIMFKLRFAV